MMRFSLVVLTHKCSEILQVMLRPVGHHDVDGVWERAGALTYMGVQWPCLLQRHSTHTNYILLAEKYSFYDME